MKKIFLLLMLVVSTMTANAQWIRIWQNGESTREAVSDVPSIPYSASGSTLSINGRTYSTAAIDSITVVYPVNITWNGATAAVVLPDNVEGVTFTVNGADVVINNTNVMTEYEFVLSGSSTAGSLTYYGSYKCKFHLNGVSLTSTKGAALDIQCGKRIDLILAEGTTNNLTDCANGTQKAALNCQGHLEINGSGTLNIAGNTGHGLRSKEYLQLKSNAGTINVTKAKADGVHCGQFFTMNGGTLNISGHGSDGLQLEPEYGLTPADEDYLTNGIFTLNGGTIKVVQTSQDSKAIRADSLIAVMNLKGGTIDVDLTSTALGSKAIACDGNININQKSGTMNITIGVAGGVYKDTTTGETNRATGIKCDDTITMDAGTVTINATGTKSRGMNTKDLTVNGGTLSVNATGSSSQGIKYTGTYTKGTGATVNCNKWTTP